MKISELQKEVHAIAKEKGWWEKPRSWEEICCLIHSEISEALEEYRNCGLDGDDNQRDGLLRLQKIYYVDKKPEGFPIELADIIIRILDYLENRNWAIALNKEETLDEYLSSLSCFTHMEKTTVISCLHEAHASLHANKNLFYNLSECFNVVLTLFHHLNIDIENAIKVKMEYNKTRLYRHGGKKL